VKRLINRVVMALVTLALVAVFVAALRWVVSTPQGARWLLRSLGDMSAGAFSVGSVSGRIGDHLLLGRVRLSPGQVRVDVERFELRWKPELLLAGTIAVQELNLERVRIQDDTPPDAKPLDLTWPRIPPWGSLLDVIISRLRVTDLSYRRLREEPLRVTSADCSVSWREERLSLDLLTLALPAGRVRGALSAGFGQPTLRAELDATLAQPVAEMNRFVLRVAPAHAREGEQLAGTVTLGGGVARGRRVELAGEVGMTRTSLNLRRIRLTRPGRRGTLTVDGSLLFGQPQPLLSLRILLAGIDLGPELNFATNISGTMRFSGSLDSYQGDFALANQARGWRSATLAATYGGTRSGMGLTRLSAAILDGTLGGTLDVGWDNGFALRGALSARNLNPSRIAPEWRGVVNMALTGDMAWSGSGQPAGRISASLLKSRLHGQPLTGELQAQVSDGDVTIGRILLSGNGFDLWGKGKLNRRIDLEARISDFSRLIPGTAGTFRGGGWVALNDGRPSGAIEGTGSGLAYAGARAAGATLNVRLGRGTGYPLHVAASLREVKRGNVRLNSVTVAADGTISRHDLNATLRSRESEARLTLAAGYGDATWRGTIGSLAGRDASGPWTLTAPASFAVGSGRFFLSPLQITAGRGEHLQLAADLGLNPLAGQLQAQWGGVNLGRGNPFLKDARITGMSDGTLRLGFLPGKRLLLGGSVSASGAVSAGGKNIAFKRGQLTFNGGEQGVRLDLDVATTTSGSLKGNFSSTAPLGLALPEKGKLVAELDGVDLGLFKAWLPADTAVEGRLSGRVDGVTLVGQRFELNGTCSLSGGSVQRKRPDGELRLEFRTAALTWNWRGETLSGDLSLAMERYGQLRAAFQLPVPAALPMAVNSRGPLRATLTGRFQERGMLAALFPGMVRETSGELDARCDIGGNWETPRVEGTLRLARAGAYLPSAGIQLKDVQLAARLERDLIRVDSFRASSGPGHISGTARITLAGWQATGMTGRIQGENFQAIAFPELRVMATPDLSFEGTPRRMVLRGELRIPEMRIADVSSRARISPSSDVVMEGRGVPPATESPLLLDARVRVVLGERVSVKASGIDATLGGGVDLTMNGWEKIASSGEIRVVKGRFRTYGVNLEIVRGRLFFTGGPIDRPTLDFLALRTIGDVKAGVTVAGTLQRPVTKLYSEPAMQDSDILAYVVLGHPLGNDGGQANLMAKAAGALLGSSQASVLFDRIRDQLGLSTLEVQDSVGGSGTMGYKPLQVTPPGKVATTQESVAETTLSVGKYLTPRLYVSYGRSLFTGSNLFRLRYDIFKNWQIETQAGSESGVDLYYKLEFK
jgi:translocation and assembly module TamB